MSETTIKEGSSLPIEDRDLIPQRIKILWAFGAYGVAFMMNAVAGLTFFYLISVLNVSPALAGLVIFVPKLFDAITDPIIGTWSDRLAAGKSRRRPFLLAGAFISALSFLMIFTTPMFDNETMTAAYVFTALMFLAIGYTVFNIPYMSMPAEMTNDYHERSSIHGYRVIAFQVGAFTTGSIIPFILEEIGRTDWLSYAKVGVVGAFLIFTTMMIAWAGTAKARFTDAPKVRRNPFAEIGHVFKNGHFIRLLLVKFCQLLGVAATIAGFKYFVLYGMGRNFTDLGLFGVSVIASGLVFVPLIVKLSKYIGKSQTYMISASFYVIAVASWYVADPNGEPIAYILLRGVFLGAASTGNVIMAMSMLTDIINYDSKQTQIRREGVFVSFYSFVEKFTFSLGPLILGVALQWAGYQEDLSLEAKQSPEIRHAMLLGVTYVPVIMGLTSIWLLSGYKLKKEDIEG